MWTTRRNPSPIRVLSRQAARFVPPMLASAMQSHQRVRSCVRINPNVPTWQKKNMMRQVIEELTTNKLTRDRAALDAIEIMEILADTYPDIIQSERVYGLARNRIARFLRDRECQIEADIVQQFIMD
jgi:hypothetical protein